MSKKLALTVAAGAVLAGAMTVPATAATTTGPVTAKPAACKPHPAGKHWACIKPGSFCPAAAKNKDGYPEKSKQRYRCSQYPDHRWRWKRV